MAHEPKMMSLLFSVNHILVKQPYSLVYILCMAASPISQQSLIEPNIFLYIYLQKKFAKPWPNGVLHKSENERTMKQHE